MISLHLYEINELNIFICKACLVRQLKKPGLVCLLYATLLKHSTLQSCQRYSCFTFDQFFVPLPFINKQYFIPMDIFHVFFFEHVKLVHYTFCDDSVRMQI